MLPRVARQKEENGPRRILVVDEALPVRRKLADVLARAGVSATQLRMAESAEEALEAFALHHPDVVFAELVGMGDEGLGVILEMLRIDPATRVVLVTAEPRDSPMVRRAVRAGVFALVEKPIRYDKIRQVLADLDAEEGGIERFR